MDHEEILPEFDKTCIGLELQITPLTKAIHWQFNSMKKEIATILLNRV